MHAAGRPAATNRPLCRRRPSLPLPARCPSPLALPNLRSVAAKRRAAQVRVAVVAAVLVALAAGFWLASPPSSWQAVNSASSALLRSSAAADAAHLAGAATVSNAPTVTRRPRVTAPPPPAPAAIGGGALQASLSPPDCADSLARAPGTAAEEDKQTPQPDVGGNGDALPALPAAAPSSSCPLPPAEAPPVPPPAAASVADLGETSFSSQTLLPNAANIPSVPPLQVSCWSEEPAAGCPQPTCTTLPPWPRLDPVCRRPTCPNTPSTPQTHCWTQDVGVELERAAPAGHQTTPPLADDPGAAGSGQPIEPLAAATDNSSSPILPAPALEPTAPSTGQLAQQQQPAPPLQLLQHLISSATRHGMIAGGATALVSNTATCPNQAPGRCACWGLSAPCARPQWSGCSAFLLTD